MATGTGVEVVMPQMGVSVSEGTITKWLKAEGETVAADEPLLEISTDKVDTEVPSPASGVLGQILVQEGETVDVGTRIALIVGEGGAVAPAPPEAAPEPAAPEAAPEPTAAPAAGLPEAVPKAATPSGIEVTEAPEEPEDGTARSFVSPVVARIAAEHAVDVSQVPGTGRGGRVTKSDILAFVEQRGAASTTGPAEPTPTAPPIAPPTPTAPAPAPTSPSPAPAPAPPAPTPSAAAPPAPAPPAPAPASVGDGEALERMSVMRRSIAEHMRHSVETFAPVTTVFEVDMAKVVAIRNRLKGDYEQRHGVRLTFLPFVARAAIDALAAWPWINAEIRGESIVVKQHVNLGVAVALDDGKGLIVPVVRNAEEKNLLGIARAVQDLADRARSKKLSPDEVQGVTFTITNPGGFGAIAGTPIIPIGTSAILDIEAIVKRPVVVTDANGDDAIAIRPMMNLCLTYDHRLIDGAYAAPFMRDLRANLESWDEEAY